MALSGCGAGTAAVVAGTGDSGSGSAPALDSFGVERPKLAPCVLRFEASQATRVALFYELDQGERAMTGLTGSGSSGNEIDLVAGETLVEWDFEDDLDGGAFRKEVRLVAKRGGSPLTGGELVVGLGNDAPTVDQVLVPVDEATGAVAIDLVVSDSSSDVVALTAEWRRASAAPDAWRPATALGLFPAGIATTPEGVALTFFWDTQTDLGRTEDDVLVRFTPDDGTRDGDDPIGVGEPHESESFRIDNNAAPLVLLDSGPLLANPDERRGIPVPYRLVDPEGDPVEVVFQWRREGEGFVPLDLARLDEILADPAERQAHRICSPFRDGPRDFLEPIDATTVRIPALGEPEALARDLASVGEQLALYRSAEFVDLATTWASNPLGNVTHALALGEGLTALVADSPTFPPFLHRLREVELATGRVVREIGNLCCVEGFSLEPSGEDVLIVTEDGAQWELLRLELASGSITPVALGPSQGRGVGGVAALGSGLAALTLGHELLRVDAVDPNAEPRVRSVFEGAQELNGVVHDPLRPRRVYVSEHDRGTFSGQVLSVDLDTGQPEPIQAPDTLERVSLSQQLALEDNGTRLLVGREDVGNESLFALELGVAAAGLERFDVAAECTSIATGPNGLRVLAAGSRLFAAGGLEQVRRVAAREIASGVVTVEEPFSPPLHLGQTARLLPGPQRAGTPSGVRAVFLWDSADVVDSADVYLRAVPRDSDVGLAVETGVAKHVKGPLELEAEELAALSSREFVLADMDQDQDLDLVATGLDGLRIFLQEGRGRFEPEPLFFDIPSSGPAVGGRSLAAVDLDGDGARDLVVNTSFDMVFLYQESPGVFSAPLSLGETTRTIPVEARDFDGDGDVDLATVRAIFPRAILIYSQLAPRVFDPQPRILFESVSLLEALDAADLDADGDADLCAWLSSGEFLVLFQSTAGAFDPPVVIGFTSTPASQADIVAADLDGDGDLDLATTSLGVHVFFQVEPGVFDPDPLRRSSEFSRRIEAGDIDGDGRLDLLTSTGLAFLQLPGGEFAVEPRRFIAPTNSSAFAVGDIDADGDADVVSNGPAGVLVQFQTGGRPRRTSLAELSTGGSLLSIVDMDADGDLDLLTDPRTGVLHVHRQRSPGEFDPTARVVDGIAVLPGGVGLLTADLDVDGDLDLVVPQSENLLVFLQQEDGTFGPPVVLGALLFPSFLEAADVDGDGLLDLLADTSSSHVAVFLQTTPGTFGPEILLGGPELGIPRSVAVADLDGDGDPDVAVGLVVLSTDDRVAVFHQGADGEFDTPPLVLEESITPFVRALDLDLDGKTDLVLDSGVAYYQDGPRAFERVVIGCSPNGDLDGDGDIDGVESTFPGAGVFWNRRPLRIFDGPDPVTESPYTFSSARDFDGDGDLDLLFDGRDGLGTEDTWAVFQNRSPGFDPEPLVIARDPFSDPDQPLQALDLDGDGERDLVGSTSSSVLIFWGGR